MNKYIFALVTSGAVMAASLSSCGDLDGDYASIVPEQYHTILSLNDSGVKEVNMSVADGNYTYEVAVLKGGVDKDAVTDVMIETPTQEWVDENYNEKQGTNYKVLPASMYTVTDYHLKIQPGQSGKSAFITFDAEKIYAAMRQPENVDRTLVLPVTIQSEGNQINPDKNTVLLQCSVTPVVISFESGSQNIMIPDNESEFTDSFIVEKRGDAETKVRFEVMSQQYLDEHYSIPEGVSYKALSADMYQMQPTAVVEASEQYYSHPVIFDVDKIKNAADNSTLVLPLILISETTSSVVDRSEMLLICTFHNYEMRALTNKDSWSVVYGTIAMAFGPYAKMFDGNDDSDGWMGFINDGFPGSQNLGKPYVVLDLGGKVMLGECGVQLGFNGDAWDVMPTDVEFYVSEDIEIDPALTSTEWDLLNARGNYGDAGNLSQDYLTLHNRLHDFDETIEWTKVGAITGHSVDPSATGQFWVAIPQNILSRNLRTRYLKIVATPAKYGTTPGDRTKINEVHLKVVTSIDGEPVE